VNASEPPSDEAVRLHPGAARLGHAPTCPNLAADRLRQVAACQVIGNQ